MTTARRRRPTREWKALTDKDKADFVQMFADIGIEVERPEGI
jgi:hypothetical protein